MGVNEAALIRLWQEKRGDVEPEDLSGNLVVQLGKATEQLNREWFEAATGQLVTDVQKHIRHPGLHWMGATLDGRVEASGAVFESKFMLPWSFSEEAAVREICSSAATQHVRRRCKDGGPFHHHRRRQVGRNQDPCRSALPASRCHRRAKILALR